MSNEEEKALKKREPTSTTWKKGQPSPNPKGRPSREVEREYLDIMVATCTPDRWAKICERAVHDAEKGDKYARDWLGAHMVGEPAKVHEYMIQENRAITIHVVWEQPSEIIEGETPRLLQEGELIESGEENE